MYDIPLSTSQVMEAARQVHDFISKTFPSVTVQPDHVLGLVSMILTNAKHAGDTIPKMPGAAFDAPRKELEGLIAELSSPRVVGAGEIVRRLYLVRNMLGGTGA